MAAKDQSMRKEVEKGGKWDYSIDKRNTKGMKQIVKNYGWPTIKLVGKRASKNAWLLVQHADHDKPFQKRVLKILNEIMTNSPDSIDKSGIAYLTDRILVAEGKKQEFGTQFCINQKDQLIPRPIRDRKNVNKRREQYNLDPIEQYLEDAKKYIPLKT